jgi:microcystin-dependent protein
MPRLQGVNKSGLVVGSIIQRATEDIPGGFLLCDGSAVSRTTFAELFAAIATKWGIGDGATTFNLPDMRGQIPRGRDDGAGTDPDAGSRVATNGGASGDNVGSGQADAFDSHAHDQTGLAGTTAPAGAFTVAISNGAVAMGRNTQNTGGSETRPKNKYVDHLVAFA